MVRPSYSLSAEIPHQKEREPTKKLDRLPIFKPEFSCGDVGSLNGFRPLPAEWGIDWSFFLPDVKSDLPEPTEELPFGDFVRPQPAYRIDTMLVDPLSMLPDLRNEKRPDRKSLPSLNLQRGIALGLPSGQAVARRMGLKPLTDDQLWIDPGNLDDDAAKARRDMFTQYAAQLHENAPLWYYILREAELADAVKTDFEDEDEKPASQVLGGSRLGDVGGRIVAEVLIGLVVADNQSYLVQDPNWRPTVKDMSCQGARFELSDVVNYVDS